MISKDQKNESLIVWLVHAVLVKYSFGCGNLIFFSLKLSSLLCAFNTDQQENM